MDIQARKLAFIQEFIRVQNEELIVLLERLLHSGKISQDNDFNPMTIAEFNKRIDQSLADSENGKLTTSEDLIAEIEEWS